MSIYNQVNNLVLRRPVEAGQFTSWAFSEQSRQAGLAPSMGTVGDAFDNALMESFWGRVQTELLNRKKWKTRLELTAALFEYLERLSRKGCSLGVQRVEAPRMVPLSGRRRDTRSKVWPWRCVARA